MKSLFTKEGGNYREYSEKYHCPLSPSPSFAIDNKASDNRSSQMISKRLEIFRDYPTYPIPGPKNGVKMNIVEGIARFTGLNVSLIVPPAIASDGAKQKPARKRRIQTPTNVWLKPAPSVKGIQVLQYRDIQGICQLFQIKAPQPQGRVPARTHRAREGGWQPCCSLQILP